MKVAVTPSATPLLTREAIFKLKEAGVVRLAVSLDGSTPEIHDAFRGLSGAWARTIEAIQWANEAGIPIQVHSTLSRHNAHDLDNLCALFEKLAIVMWNVFFLVPVGRGQLDDLLSGEEFEQVFGKIYELSHRVNFQIKTTEAMHYRRYLLQHNLEERRMGMGHPHAAGAGYEAGTPTADAQSRTAGWATRRVNDGKGFLFISHVGNVYPSGSCPSMPATSGRRRSPTSTGMRPSLNACGIRINWKASAAPANTKRFAAARVPVPMRSPATRWPGTLLHLPAEELDSTAG